MKLLALLLTSSLVPLGGCLDQPAHLSRAAVQVKSACPATARTPGSVGLDVRAGRRQSQSGTLFVTNVGADARSVQIDHVSRTEGSCGGEWARTTALDSMDSITCRAPDAISLAPGAWEQIEVGEQRVHATWPCTKLALAVWIRVEGDLVCADGGAWIASQGDELAP